MAIKNQKSIHPSISKDMDSSNHCKGTNRFNKFIKKINDDGSIQYKLKQ